ncbi:MAG: anti-sigma factor [Verrucomicrobiota bacterium]
MSTERPEKSAVFPVRKPPQPAVWLPWGMAACLALICVIFVQDRETHQQQAAELMHRISELDENTVALRKESHRLQAELAQIKELNRMASVRVALLNPPLADSKAAAVSIWNNQTQSGVLLARNLKPLDGGKSYQLWINDPKYPSPVSAGVFEVEAGGSVRYEFKPALPVQAADGFLVSEERNGATAPAKDRIVMSGDALPL